MDHLQSTRFSESNIVQPTAESNTTVDAVADVLNVCCCPNCIDPLEEAKADYSNALDSLPGAVDNTTLSSGLPSFGWDQAAEQLSRWNAKWDDDDANGGVAGNALGTPGTVTFAFLLDPSDPNARAMTSAEILRTMQAIGDFEEVANINFIRVLDGGSEYIADADDAQIVIQAQDGTNGGYATPYWQNGELLSSTVNVGVSGHADHGSWSYKTTLHEIGHAVGLAHPCLLYTSPSPRDATLSRMPSSA